MSKRIKTKREKRLQQLMTLIIVTAISLVLNVSLIIAGVIIVKRINLLEGALIERDADYHESVLLLESYISQQSYELELAKNQTTEDEKVEEVVAKQEEEKQEIVYDTGKIAYLTFDDGPTDLTPKILDVLDQYNVKATFFMLGVRVKYYPDVIKRMVESGHSLGNHTVTHNYEAIYVSSAALKNEIQENNKRIYEISGVVPKAFRFPGGSSNSMFAKYSDEPLDNFLSLIGELDMEYYDWNVSSLDASSTPKSAAEITNAVLTGAQGKNTITVLMHDAANKQTTLEALPGIIEGLQEQGFTILPLTETSYPVQHRTINKE